MIPNVLLLAQDVLPQTGEAWAFVGTVFAALCTGIGVLFKFWADRRIASQTAELKEKQTASESLAASQSARIAEAKERELWARSDAERREQTANVALEGMARLTAVVTDLTGTVKQLHDGNRTTAEEVRRLNASVESLVREVTMQRRG